MNQLTNRKQLTSSEQAELYQRIQAFSLDVADARLPFSKRLARDNGWTIEYAHRVINEYKKFIFLAVVADHPVSPSDEVDLVWHLHLLYTHSYWEEFCLKVLQMPLHHSPTQGGLQEQRKFDDWYNKTLASYEEFFQQSPPVDIWPPSHIHFGQDLHFRRVNTQSNWILPKPQLNFLSELSLKPTAIFLLSLFLALSVTGCALSGVANLSNPLKFSLNQFTAFYLSAACFGIVVINLLWLFQRRSETSRIRVRSLLVLTFILFFLVISKITIELSSLTGREFLGFYSLAMVAALVLDFFARSQTKLKTSGRLWVDYTPSWEEFMQVSRSPFFDKAINWLTLLSVFVLYFLGISRIILGISRERPVGYLAVLCLIVGIQLIYLLFNRFKEEFSDSFRTLIAIPLFLSILFFLYLAFRGLVISIFVGGLIVTVLLQGSNSGSGGGGSGDGGGGDGGGGGCGGVGCGGCGGCGG